ncbi:hypothetical protein J7J47_07775 [Halomonas sp. ISL-60]|uniref:hypothetical protein n=1 Tax=Halomonas sp. ISL-56 TaxID=2819149 RepID=UPI001BECECF9|nr:hypothetical protein [Halomonas sp. ISL-56]MBT2772130.1 hypothetical protein [Halomonas sp. ISL-60]MBT2803741.1 hypothetical protein [Halomonas sp. ISL-56]
MNHSSPPKWILIVGLGVIMLTFLLYGVSFGPHLSNSQSTWAEFGAFFGGLLSPFLAFLAIVMLYHTLDTQLSEFRASVTHLSKTAELAAQDLELSKRQNLDNETLAVLASGEKQISELINQIVSERGTNPEIKIFHLCLEARRSAHPLARSDSYTKFISMARTEGSVVWSYVFALHEIVDGMVAVLKYYRARHSTQFSPTILYYQKRLLAVSQLLADAEFISDEERIEVATMADHHG